MSIHSKMIATRRQELKGKTKQDLLNRRTLLEVVIREADKQQIDWRHEAADKDDPRLTVKEQYDLLDEALLALDPAPGQSIPLKEGIGKIHTFRQGE